jgi:hypothetical protein
MDGKIERIHMQYLQEEIIKMQKTAKGLTQMINEKDPEKDDDLIKSLKQLRSTTLDNIENKEKELEEIYNKKVEIDNN